MGEGERERDEAIMHMRLIAVSPRRFADEINR